MEPIALKHNDEIIDLQTAMALGISGQEIDYDNSDEALEVIRHSTAHLMAQAIKSLFPDAKFYVGPVVKEGFYYDFKTESEVGSSMPNSGNSRLGMTLTGPRKRATS